MARISGVDIPPNKPIHISLRYVYGLGRKNTLDVCRAAGPADERHVAGRSFHVFLQLVFETHGIRFDA